MDRQFLSPKFFAVTGMVLIAGLLRLLPHYPNFTPIAAMALFGGTYFSNKKIAFIIPFAAMILTDAIIGFHSTMWAVYLSFAIIVLIGFSLREKRKVSNIFFASVSSSVLFFIITNIAVWASGGMYPMNFAGLAESYIAAIPFFGYTLVGDLFYVGIFFGAFEFAKAKIPVLAEVKA